MPQQQKLAHVKVGDVLTRILGNKPMPVLVGKIYNSIIYVGNMDQKFPISWEEGWTFSMTTGGEIDIDLGWDGIHTGSYIQV